MTVAQKDRVDGRQVFIADSGRAAAFDAQPGCGANPVAPDGISQDVRLSVIKQLLQTVRLETSLGCHLHGQEV